MEHDGKNWTTEKRKPSCTLRMEWLSAPHIEQEGKDAAMEMQNPQSRMCAGNMAIDGRASTRLAKHVLLKQWIISSKIWLY